MNKNYTNNPDGINKDTFVSQEVFHLGRPEVTEDVFTGKERYLYWSISEDDMKIANAGIAGWEEFYRGDDEAKGLVGKLEVPTDTISARSALAGMEAWLGEKDEILDTVSKYVHKVYQHFGSIDANLSLDSVAVRRGNSKIFILPPHQIVELDEMVATKWLNEFYTELDKVLTNEPRKDELIAGLHRNIGFLKKR